LHDPPLTASAFSLSRTAFGGRWKSVFSYPTLSDCGFPRHFFVSYPFSNQILLRVMADHSFTPPLSIPLPFARLLPPSSKLFFFEAFGRSWRISLFLISCCFAPSFPPRVSRPNISLAPRFWKSRRLSNVFFFLVRRTFDRRSHQVSS